MRLFFLIISVVFIFAGCGDSKVAVNKNDNESATDIDQENVDDPQKDDETLNDSDSTDAVCGNEKIEADEECDGNVVFCTEIDDKLYSGGKAKCKDDCSGFLTITCDEILYECGDGKVEGPEVCDGDVEDCVSINASLYSGGKAKCKDDCSGYIVETCVEIFHECGNGIVEWSEICDGNLKDCVDISSTLYSGGKALCNDTCNGWDTVTCEENIGQCSDTVRVIQCTADPSKDQIQSCSDGSWSNEGACFAKDEYILVKSGDSSKSYSVTFSSTIDEVDVLTILDTSGSLTEELGIIKSNVSTMTQSIVDDYPDAAFGMTTLGTLGYTVYSIIHNIDETVSNYVSSVSSMTTIVNGSAEYHTAAIDQAVSGTGTYQLVRSYEGGSQYTVNIPAASCSVGERGGVCFRENSLPVVIVISDEAIDMDGWIWDIGLATTADDVSDSLNAINAKIGIIDASGTTDPLMVDDAAKFALDTNSYDSAGEPFHKAISSADTVLDAWITMVKNMISDTVMDIELDIDQGASNPVNVLDLIDSSTALSASPPSGIDGKSGAEFQGVQRHTSLTYKVVFSNSGSSTGVKFSELILSAVWGDIVVGTKTITVVTD